MAWYLYDKNGYVNQIATYQGLSDMEKLFIQPLNRFLSNLYLETDADKQQVLDALEPHPELKYLYDMLQGAVPPLIVSDGADSRVAKFHQGDTYLQLPEEDWIQNADDAIRVYQKYAGQD